MRRTQPACLPVSICRYHHRSYPFFRFTELQHQHRGAFFFCFFSSFLISSEHCVVSYTTLTHTHIHSRFSLLVSSPLLLCALSISSSLSPFSLWFRHLPAYLPNHPSPSFRLTLPDASSLAHIILLIYFRRKRPIRP